MGGGDPLGDVVGHRGEIVVISGIVADETDTGSPKPETGKRQRGEWFTYHRPCFESVNGKIERIIKPEQVRVMARAEGYAMVRRKGCLPFVVKEKELI